MAFGLHKLESTLSALERALLSLRPRTAGGVMTNVDRWRSDAEAVRFHLRDEVRDRPMLVTIIGGTGTGKSTLVNRLLGAQLTATSFRRTYTSGAVAIAGEIKNLPPGWLAIEHRPVEELPARGQADALCVIREELELTKRVTLIDTPDLDGDQPLHHAQADRAFRWAHGVIFLVTPEKYQMTELLPYYRLSRRYAIPTLFVMNKAEEQGVVDDFQKQLAGREWEGARLFALPRDDAPYEPPAEANLDALREAVIALRPAEKEAWRDGLRQRAIDLLGRLGDQILAPIRLDRQQIDRLVASVRTLETPEIGLDVNPLTQQLQKRLQQRSVLYLMGPQRILERVRQVPGMVLRMPRTIWDVVMRGQGIKLKDPARTGPQLNGEELPDFKAAVTDQFTVVQSRIEDVLRSSAAGQRWITAGESSYRQARLDPATAGRIAEDELTALEKWLSERWNATPRDTMLLMKLVKHLPGGERLTKWTEAAPYLLAVIVATHHVFFGPVDLAVIGGFSIATWLSEKLSNEVTQKARATNRKIAERFSELTHTQIDQVCGWLDSRAPSEKEIREVEDLMERLHGVLEEEKS